MTLIPAPGQPAAIGIVRPVVPTARCVRFMQHLSNPARFQPGNSHLGRMTMRITLLAITAALAATPAAAQLVVGGQGGVTGNLGVGVDTGRTLDNVNRTLDTTVDRTDRTVNSTLDRTVNRDLSVATSADVTGGATVRDSRGRRVGTVQSVHGGTAVVVRNGRQLHVPISSLSRSGRGLVTSLSPSQLNASTAADVRADAQARD
jgi:hypothetical protein